MGTWPAQGPVAVPPVTSMGLDPGIFRRGQMVGSGDGSPPWDPGPKPRYREAKCYITVQILTFAYIKSQDLIGGG